VNRRKKRRWLSVFVVSIFSVFLVWILAFLVWLYWPDLQSFFQSEAQKGPAEKSAGASQEILEEERKQLEEILKRR